MPKKIDRDCVIRLLKEGLRFSEIARRCGCSEKTVRRIARSLDDGREEVLVIDVEPHPVKREKEAKEPSAGELENEEPSKSTWELLLEF